MNAAKNRFVWDDEDIEQIFGVSSLEKANYGGDWAKKTFDIMVDTAEEYAQEFGLNTADKILAHINAKVGTPYWSGVPLEIKAGLVRIAQNMKQ